MILDSGPRLPGPPPAPRPQLCTTQGGPDAPGSGCAAREPGPGSSPDAVWGGPRLAASWGGRRAQRAAAAQTGGRVAWGPAARRKSHLPRRAPEAAGGHGGAGRRAGGGRGPAGGGEGCSAPQAPPAPPRQPQPRRPPGRGGPLPLRQSAPGLGGTDSSGKSEGAAGRASGWESGPIARPSVQAPSERLPPRPAPSRQAPPPLAPPPPRRLWAPGDCRRLRVGGFHSPRAAPADGPGLGNGGKEGRRGETAGRARAEVWKLMGEEDVSLGGALGQGAGAAVLTKIPVVPRPLKLGTGHSWVWKFRKRSLCRAGRRPDGGPGLCFLGEQDCTVPELWGNSPRVASFPASAALLATI